MNFSHLSFLFPDCITSFYPTDLCVKLISGGAVGVTTISAGWAEADVTRVGGVLALVNGNSGGGEAKPAEISHIMIYDRLNVWFWNKKV